MDNNEPQKTTRERASEMIQQGRYAEATSALRAVVEIEETDETAWRLLGGALSAQGKHDDAVASFTRALNLAPESPRSHYNLGLALRAAGRVELSQEQFQTALALDPNYAPALQQLRELGGGSAETARPTPPASSPPSAWGGQTARESIPTPPQYARAAYDTPLSTPTDPYATPSGGQAQRPLPQNVRAAVSGVNATTPLVLSIIGLVGGWTCGLPMILSPIALSMANKELAALNALENPSQSDRSNLNAARIMGIIGTVFLALGVLVMLLFFVLALIGAVR